MFYTLKRIIHIKRLKKKLKNGEDVYFQDENNIIIRGRITSMTETQKIYSWHSRDYKEIIFHIESIEPNVRDHELYPGRIYLSQKAVVKDLLGDLKEVNELLQLKMLK